MPFEELREEGHEVTGLFYNPNVHPLIEFRRRLKAQRVLQERLPIAVIYVEEYGLREFLEAVDWRGGGRCEDCYRLRLSRTARKAADRGMDAMTTTLLSSRHQDHQLIRRVGEECAEQAGVEFLYRNWRPLAEESHRRAQKMNLYLQSYCGCIFSECERYRETSRHLYRGPGPLEEPQPPTSREGGVNADERR